MGQDESLGSKQVTPVELSPPQEVSQAVLAAATYRVGPLPPPAELKEYEALMPGVTKILFDNYIKQSNHRMDLEKTVITGDNKRADKGQTISGILAALGIVVGGVLSFMGKDVAGLSLIIGSLGTLLTAFYGGAIIRKNERVEKEHLQS
jgi:uncharacterized membrane protein